MPSNAKKPQRGAAEASQFNRKEVTDHRTASTTTDTSTVSQQTLTGKAESLKNPLISWTWRGANFVRIEPGIYRNATVAEMQGPEYVPLYHRHSLRIGFHIFSEDVIVSAFFNFGKSREPRVSSQSRYFHLVNLVNGAPPCKGQDMSPQILREPGLLFTVRVVDALIGTDRKDKPPSSVYSRVEEVLEVTRA